MTTITATTILRSRHAQRPDKILSTLLLRYPRWIHAELMTHRVFSRNAASSRAIPVDKLIQDVIDNPAMPIHWGKNQKGMQANEELTGTALQVTKDLWTRMMQTSVMYAQAMNHQGAHKQIINRLLEPYAHITVLVSSTEWSNFLALRDHADAEPHIAMLARKVRRELEREDNIQTLEPGEWHTPFVADEPGAKGGAQALLKKSVACSASTSYKTVDGFDMTLEKAIVIHDKLVGSTPIHASPAEHVAQADYLVVKDKAMAEASAGPGELYAWDPAWAEPQLHGNFVGFRQYRKMLPGESL